MCGGGWSDGAELEAVLYLTSSFPFLFAFDVGGLGFEFCEFVAGWTVGGMPFREPFIISIVIITTVLSRLDR